MVSAETKSVIDRAKQIYARQLQSDLESQHMDRFVAIEPESGESTYDEFCLVANFIVDPLRSVDLLPVRNLEALPGEVVNCLQQRKRKRKASVVDVL